MSMACFKAYDIRGKVPDDLNASLAYQIGSALVAELKPQNVVVGQDMRLESPEIASALMQGILDAGADVLDIGLCGTEEVYFATQHHKAGAGVMVTASHNPKGYNGMKLVREESRPISGDSGLFAIRDRVMHGEQNAATTQGRVIACPDKSAYIAHLLSYIDVATLRPLKILADPGNGMAGNVVKALAPHLPFEWVFIHDEPDGHFPNGVPNPLLPENRALASRSIVEHGCDLGLAWDGDFDRCFFYDATGRFIEGYYLVGLLAELILKKYPGEKIIHDPRLTWNTIEQVREAGGFPIASKTGHAFIKERMRAENAIYGGEMSAHHYFRDFAYCDSGMIPWLLITALMSQESKTLADLVNMRLEAFPCSGEINYKVDNPDQIIDTVETHFAHLNPVIDRIDGLSMEMEQVRFNIRVSNTEPLLRLNVEARGDIHLMKDTLLTLEQCIQSSDRMDINNNVLATCSTSVGSETGEQAHKINIRRLNADDQSQLIALFSDIKHGTDQIHFHPHPFDADNAIEIAQYKGNDLYVGMFDGGTLVGYGLLRGWDEGFDIPSLGIYLKKSARGKGLSTFFMHELHHLARNAKAGVVRLKVFKDNVVAKKLYQKLGYVFESEENNQLVGFMSLNQEYGAV